MTAASRPVPAGRLFVVDGRLVFAAFVATVAIAAVVSHVLGWAFVVMPLMAAIMFAGIGAMRRRGAATIRLNAQGLEALLRDDFTAARASFGEMARGVRWKQTATLALYNLAQTEMHAGDLEAAVEPLRRALAVCIDDSASTLSISMIRAQVAIALCACGRLEQAEPVVAAAAEPDAPVAGQIGLSVARALIALGRGRLDAALEELDSTRALRLAEGYAVNLALSEAIEAVALAGLGGVYRGRARRGTGLPWRESMRAWVGRVVPGGEAVLVAL